MKKLLTLMTAIIVVVLSTNNAFGQDTCNCKGNKVTIHHRHTTAAVAPINITINDTTRVEVQPTLKVTYPASATVTTQPRVEEEHSNSSNDSGLIIIGIIALVVVIGIIAIVSRGNNGGFLNRNNNGRNDDTVAIIEAIHTNGGSFSDGNGRHLRVNSPIDYTVQLRNR